MSTAAQIAANQQNGKLSHGPVTEEGKAASCLNNFRHGFAAAFTVLPCEDQEEFDTLLHGLRHEHQPKTMTEIVLVEKMAQHHWLVLRALRFQEHLIGASDMDPRIQERQFALYLRYQTTNERAFHRSLNDLLKLRAERRKAEIGFESQRQKQAEQGRKDSIEKRKQEHHKFDVLLAEAKVDHQLLLNMNLEHAATMAALRENRPNEVKAAA